MPIYEDDGDDESDIVDYEPQEDKVIYQYIPAIPLERHPVKPDVVMDCFFGAGTTGVVAKKLNRDFIGIEINKNYVAMAHKRLQKEMGAFYSPAESNLK